MPIHINIDKAKNIFEENYKNSISYEINRLTTELEDDDVRLSALKEFYKDYKPDLTEIKTITELDKAWPDILPFKPSDELFQKTIIHEEHLDTDYSIAGCELLLGPMLDIVKLLNSVNISFIINKENWKCVCVPLPNLLNKNEEYKLYSGWDQTLNSYAFSILNSEKLKINKDNFKLKNSSKRIILQKPDKSVIVIIPANTKIDLEELIAKISYIPRKNEWAYTEVFDSDELPSHRYRDAWELLTNEQADKLS